MLTSVKFSVHVYTELRYVSRLSRHRSVHTTKPNKGNVAVMPPTCFHIWASSYGAMPMHCCQFLSCAALQWFTFHGTSS